MKILMICKYPPIQGGVSAEAYWTANAFVESGHSVFVLTNADEVEEAYKVDIGEEDRVFLRGFRIPDSIRLQSTYEDRKHVFIPESNPFVSKLVGLGLEAIESFRPDVIYSYYVEPYGIAAMLLSKLTGIPYTIRHAGSDIGRLMQTMQLKALYCRVFKEASAVLTVQTHHDMFKALGIDPGKFIRPVSVSLPGDIFHAEGREARGDRLRIGMYGKMGPAKGIKPALQAMSALAPREPTLHFSAHWRGRSQNAYVESIQGLEKVSVPSISGFIPHWKIPEFLRNQDIILFLENKFSVKFHTPGTPFEVWACGAHLITTREVAEKHHLARHVTSENTTVVDEVDSESIARAVQTAMAKLPSKEGVTCGSFDASLSSLHARAGVKKMLDSIESLI